MLRTKDRRGNDRWQPGHPCPRCGIRHRHLYKVAECRWYPTCWVQGNGNGGWQGDSWASVSFCTHGWPGPATTVAIHCTRDAAEAALRLINRCGCGSACGRLHYLYRLGADGVICRETLRPETSGMQTTR